MGRLVIGLGTGRCGTRSLAKMFNSHPDIDAWHEQKCLLWNFDEKIAKRVIDRMLNGDGRKKCDVGYYWLNYTDFLINEYDAKMVCLKRKKQEVVESFMATRYNPMWGNLIMDIISKIEDPLRYCDYVTQEQLDAMDPATREFVEYYWEEPFINDNQMKKHFPEYDITDRHDYLSKYWDEYYSESERYRDKYLNNFLLMDIDKALNTETGRKEIFNFIGVVPDTATR